MPFRMKAKVAVGRIRRYLSLRDRRRELFKEVALALIFSPSSTLIRLSVPKSQNRNKSVAERGRAITSYDDHVNTPFVSASTDIFRVVISHQS